MGPPVLLRIAAFAGGLLAITAPHRSTALDPLSTEIERGRAWARDLRDTTDFAQQVRNAVAPQWERAAQALEQGRRLAALQRVGAARLNQRAYEFATARPAAALTESTGFAAAWRREGDSLRAMPQASAARAQGIRPAALRALAETAIPQVRNYYDASLDYARSTEPRFGWFYMGVARAQREFFEMCLALSRTEEPAPALRSIAPEMDSLESRILAAYRPPLSIERHGEFIGVSSALKEARELEAEGLRYGALLRYLTAVQRFAPLRPRGAPLDSAGAIARLGGYEARIAGGRGDASIARLFLENARLEMEAAPAGHPAPAAVGIAADVLPAYFEALEPSGAVSRAALAAPPAVTVTLVRWPYT